MKRSLLLLLSIAFLLPQCSTELDVNAPYKEYTVIYGLIDKDLTTHLLKINKSFLGEGNALDMAQVPDSSQYTNDVLQAQVDKIMNGSVVETYSVNDTILTERVPGTFFYPEQKLYYFNASIDPDAEYELVCQINGRTVRARTNVVKDFSINQSDANLNIPMVMFNSNGYNNYELNWTVGPNGKRYVAYYRFNYDEVTGTDTVSKSFTREIGTRIASGSSNQQMSAILGGEDFYKSIPNLIQDDPSVDKRIFRKIDFLFEVANDDLHVYLQLNEPVTGIVEDRPPFSNVEDGLGILASRLSKQVIGKKLNDNSLLELVEGQYTGSLRFCSPDHVGAPLGCN